VPDFIELSATEEGYPLYKKWEFEEYQIPYVPMRFDLQYIILLRR